MTKKEKGLVIPVKLDLITCSAGEFIAAARMAMLNLDIDPKKTEREIDFAAARRALVIQRFAQVYQVDLQQTGAAKTLLAAMKTDTPQARAIAEKVEHIMGNRFSELSCSEEELEPVRRLKRKRERHTAKASSERKHHDDYDDDHYEPKPKPTPPKTTPKPAQPEPRQPKPRLKPGPLKPMKPKPGPPSVNTLANKFGLVTLTQVSKSLTPNSRLANRFGVVTLAQVRKHEGEKGK